MAYMKDSTGRRLDSFAVSPLRKPTVILFGDSRTADCDYIAEPLSYSTPVSWWDYGQAFRVGGPVFDVIRNAGIGGNTTTQMLARIDADVIAYNPSHMTLWGGTNDTWAAAADVEASYGRMAQMMDKARAAGIYVFLISETTANSKGSTFPKHVAYYNEMLRVYAATNAGVEFWDFNSLVTDPAHASGYNKGVMLRDGLHLSPYGATLIGREIVAKRLASRTTELAQLPVSQIDTVNLSTVSRNVANNPLMLGSTGTLGANQTGVMPTSWAASGVTAVMSTPARADGIGNDLKSVITAGAAGSHYHTLTVDPARLVGGATYVLEASMTIEEATAVSAISLAAQMYVSATEHKHGFGFRVQGLVATDAIVPGTLTIRSRPFVAPAGATGASVIRQVSFGGAGSCTDRLGRFAWRRIA